MRGNSAQSLHRRVASELRRRIVSGEYAPRAAIPSQSALVRSFGVSPITVRRAIRDLTFEGLIHPRQGRGVFVTDRTRIVRVLTAGVGASLGDEIRRAGLQPGIREVRLEPVAPAPEIARRLKLRRGARVYRHQKVILADGVPVAIDTVHLPIRLGQRMRERLRHEFVFPLLADLRLAIGGVSFRFDGALASEQEAALLGVAPPFPLVVANYVVFDGSGRAPILEGNTCARADRISFEISVGHPRT